MQESRLLEVMGKLERPRGLISQEAEILERRPNEGLRYSNHIRGLVIRLEVSVKHRHYDIIHAFRTRVDLILGLVGKKYCMYNL